MNLTDQEQVVLKAIGPGVAEVSRVIRSVGYPKATVKKVLVRLSEKGIVALHRHDWPASLKPDQRKFMVKIGSNYYGAVSVMKRNPKQSKGKVAAKRAGRAIKGLAKGALSAGAEILGAGAMALNPSRRRKKNKTIIKAKRIDHLDVAKVHNPRKRNAGTKKTSKAKRLAKLAVKGLAKKNPFSPMGFEYRKGHEFGSPPLRGQKAAKLRIRLNKLTERWEKAKTPAQLAKIKKEMDATWAQLQAVGVQNPKVKGNASRATSTAKTAKRRARSSSQTGRKKATAKVRSLAKARKASTRRASKRTVKRRNAERKDSDHPVEVTRHWRAGPPGYLTPWQRAHHAGQSQLFETGIKPAKKRNATKKATRKKSKGKRNPSAESIRKEFAGSINGERDLFFPQGTPTGKLAKLGKLVSITTEEGTIKPVHGSAWLCADTRGKLHIGSTSGAPLFDGPRRSFGHVTKLEYESSKPHLGYKGPIIWFHKAGEENGVRPTLHADGKGGLVFRGGAYRLTQRGIEN